MCHQFQSYNRLYHASKPCTVLVHAFKHVNILGPNRSNNVTWRVTTKCWRPARAPGTNVLCWASEWNISTGQCKYPVSISFLILMPTSWCSGGFCWDETWWMNRIETRVGQLTGHKVIGLGEIRDELENDSKLKACGRNRTNESPSVLGINFCSFSCFLVHPRKYPPAVKPNCHTGRSIFLEPHNILDCSVPSLF